MTASPKFWQFTIHPVLEPFCPGIMYEDIVWDSSVNLEQTTYSVGEVLISIGMTLEMRGLGYVDVPQWQEKKYFP